jgi:DNA-binding CsgD family transcriptional regulator
VVGDVEVRRRAATSEQRSRPSQLLGRSSECQALDDLAANALAGRSAVIVLRGEAGVGKSALLSYLADRVADWRVVRARGMESEMELAYSGLHQLCAPLLEYLDALPVPQRNALDTVFGVRAGGPPDRFLVGLATLTLFAGAAEHHPLACFIDDAQWLDQASAQILGFVARRVLAERIMIVAAARIGPGDDVLAGLPELTVGGLAERDARALLLANVYGPLDVAICDQILTESRGNPLALLELPRTWRTLELAGGFGYPNSRPVATRIEDSYAQRLTHLPADTQLLVLTAAAEPLGTLSLLHRAAVSLGLDMAAADAAITARLLTIDERVEFAHPLVRSAAYRSARSEDRRRVHQALADATDADIDPDRRAWHRARATARPGEDIAAELERCAGRAQARGGMAAAAAFLQRAVALSVDPVRRVERALAAAQACFQAGAFDQALALLATIDEQPSDGVQRARADLLRAHVAFTSGLGGDSASLLLAAGRRLEPFDVRLARETYLLAWGAAGMALSPSNWSVLEEVCQAVHALRPPDDPPRPLDILVDGLALAITDGYGAATPTLQRAANAAADIAVDDVLRWGWQATSASDLVWDIQGMHDLATRHVQIVRHNGALAALPLFLSQLGIVELWTGNFAGAAAVIAEVDNVAAATGSPIAPYTLMRLLALQGNERDAAPVIADTIKHAESASQGIGAAWANWSAATLHNGLARYDTAVSEAQRATVSRFPWPTLWALPELVEAATHSGHTELAREAMARLTDSTTACGTDPALGIEARCRAMLIEGSNADAAYREAVERLSRTPLRPDLGRAHLLYGEWLRRQGRRTDARQQLRTANELLDGLGMEAFAERARRALTATGEKARKRANETRNQLTPQEAQIALLAREGLSNPQIATQLFISVRTAEWHLRNVFTKLGITSRTQLRALRPEMISHAQPPDINSSTSPGTRERREDPPPGKPSPMNIRVT